MVDPEHDAIDRAYARAETMLDDEAARAARRARVLAAVDEDVAAPAPQTKPVPRFAARWLVAASLLLVSYLAVRFLPLNLPGSSHPNIQVSSAQPLKENQVTVQLLRPRAAPPAELKPPVLDLAVPVPRPPKAPPRQQMAMASPPPVAAIPSFEVATPPPPPAAPPPAAARAFPMAPAGVMRTPLAAPPPPVADLAKPSENLNNPAFDQLRAAAAAGHTDEVQALLDRQIPVDAVDADGDTALMKSIRADQPATAALLVRHGASLDKKNHAGQSARDLAAQMHDPALDHALGLEQ